MIILKIILNFLFLPFIVFWDLIKSDRSVIRKIGYGFLVLLILGSIWFSSAQGSFSTVNIALFDAGITDRLTHVKISGTSMLPTIQDGSEVTLNSPVKFGLERSDVVSFKNEETGGRYYIKRIIGLPGEEISIQNGYVTVNSKILKEDYINQEGTTFGNTFLGDCDAAKVPPSSYLVLGDNRIVSSDSRVIGFISKDNIEGVIKSKIKENFISDLQQTQILKKEISPDIFLKKLNEFRTKNKSGEVITHSELNDIAKKRADQIRDNFEDWKNQTIPAETALQKLGYRYNLVHEFVTFGYLDEQALIDQINESLEEKSQFLSLKYLEVGIGVSQKQKDNCSFPIISIILSWPAVPTYDLKVISDWGREVSTTTKITENLQMGVGDPKFDQTELRLLITSLAEQSEIATRIYSKMKSKLWLDENDQRDISRYPDLVKDSESKMQKVLNINLSNTTSNPTNQSTTTNQPAPQPTQSSTNSPGFKSNGQQKIEGPITANINSVTSDQSYVYIKVTFANNTASANNFTPCGLQMHNDTHGTTAQPCIAIMALEPGQGRSFDLKYKRDLNAPYYFKYYNTAGDAVNLGTYSP